MRIEEGWEVRRAAMFLVFWWTRALKSSKFFPTSSHFGPSGAIWVESGQQVPKSFPNKFPIHGHAAWKIIFCHSYWSKRIISPSQVHLMGSHVVYLFWTLKPSRSMDAAIQRRWCSDNFTVGVWKWTRVYFIQLYLQLTRPSICVNRQPLMQIEGVTFGQKLCSSASVNFRHQ